MSTREYVKKFWKQENFFKSRIKWNTFSWKWDKIDWNSHSKRKQLYIEAKIGTQIAKKKNRWFLDLKISLNDKISPSNIKKLFDVDKNKVPKIQLQITRRSVKLNFSFSPSLPPFNPNKARVKIKFWNKKNIIVSTPYYSVVVVECGKLVKMAFITIGYYFKQVSYRHIYKVIIIKVRACNYPYIWCQPVCIIVAHD